MLRKTLTIDFRENYRGIFVDYDVTVRNYAEEDTERIIV